MMIYHTFTILIIIIFFTSFETLSLAKSQNYYNLNKRTVQLMDDGTTISITRMIITLESDDQVAKFRNRTYTIDDKRENIELLSASLLKRNSDRNWENIKSNIQLQTINPSSNSDSGLKKYRLDIPDQSAPIKIDFTIQITSIAPLIYGQFWSMHELSADLPVERAVYEIQFPSEINVYYMMQGFDIQHEIKKTNDSTIYRWTLDDIAEQSNSSDANQYQGKAVFISSVPDWQIIADYFNREYEGKIHIFNDASLDDVVFDLTGKRILKLPNHERINAIIEAINKFKYADSDDMFIPREALETLSRKRGDCKDLAVLFVSLLKSAHIDANVVLINKDNPIDFENMLPYPYLFNHALVYIPRQDGVKAPVFFDPTNISGIKKYSEFIGLVLDEKKTGFIKIQ